MENRKINGNAGNYQNLIKGSMMRGLLGPTIGFFVGFGLCHFMDQQQQFLNMHFME